MDEYYFKGKHFTLNHCLFTNPDPNDFIMHAHEHYELLYFISGSGRFWVEGTPYQLKPHDIIIFNAGEAHRIDISSSVPYERIDIDISKSIYDTMPEFQVFLEPFISRPLGQNNLFHEEEFSDGFYKRCLTKMLVPCDSPELQIGSNLLALLNEVYTAFLNRHKEPGHSYRISSQILNYINSNLSQDISPESIAEKFFISRSHLYSIFRKTTGSSVRQYITVKRLLMARELLSAGTHPSEVSSLCGFGDYSSFFRAYRAKFGTSPRENYKKQLELNDIPNSN